MNDPAVFRRMLGWLLLWALLPLPFLYIVLPPFWLAVGVVGAVLVLRPQWVFSPSRWTLNLIGVAILVAVVAAGGLNVGPLRPLGHLLLLLTAVRVLLVDDRRTFLRALALVGMVWIVSVTASTHMTASIYFVISAVIGWWVGMGIHLTSLGIAVNSAGGAIPKLRHVLLATGAALLVATPFFLVMPRLGSPWIAGSSFSRSTGFSPAVDLGTLGRLTESQEVALVMRASEGSEIREEWIRLRGTAFDLVMAGSWLPRRTNLTRLEPTRGVVWLGPGRRSLETYVELEIDLLHPRRYLMLPPGSVAIQADTEMALDPYGGILIGYRRGEPLRYRVWVGEPAPLHTKPPYDRDIRLPGEHPQVRDLALSVAGNLATNEARAVAVERFLQDNFRYSLESGVRIQTVDPVAWFLLEGGEGHCEFFAGAMVVLLRHLEVPARMVAGYSGGDMAPDNDELVVREANAHAWVEVWLGAGRGWETFDPTPPSFVPGLGDVSGLERIRWAWQRAELLWDQRLLTFGLGEQIDLVDGVIAAFHRVVEFFRQRSVIIGTGVVGALLMVLLAAWRWWQRRVRPWRTMPRRNRGPAGRLVIRLARALVPVGGVVPPSATVRTIGNQAMAFWPQSAEPVQELVRCAHDELYGESGDCDADAAEIRQLWRRIRHGMKSRELTVEGS